MIYSLQIVNAAFQMNQMPFVFFYFKLRDLLRIISLCFISRRTKLIYDNPEFQII